MSYIIKSTSPFVSIKLTEIGRTQLALGKLNFSYWAIGDSEINYAREAIVDANPTNVTLSATSVIFRPFDKQPNLKSFVLPSTTTDPLQVVDSSIISVVRSVVNNQADTKGFFDYTGGTFNTKTGSTYVKYTSYNSPTAVGSSIFSGTTKLFINTTGITTGDYVLIKYSSYKASLSGGTLTANSNDKPLQNLWYKIQSMSASSTGYYVDLDRKLPNFNLSNFSGYSQVFVYGGGEVNNTFGADSQTAYWDSNTLSFDSLCPINCEEVPVWNMNNVWCETLAGVTGLTTTKIYEDYTKYGSYPYLGSKYPYFGLACVSNASASQLTTQACDSPGLSSVDDVVKSISILHYTNNMVSSIYGEFFYTDTANNKYLYIDLPDLMYHRRDFASGFGTEMGMRFIASGSTKVMDTDLQYIDLIEDPTRIPSSEIPLVVGKIFPQLKTVVIHDDEIVAAISYKSNRNWTLPELKATLSAPSGGTSTGVLGVNETMYLTYTLDNLGVTSGFTSALPCQKYIKITNTTSAAKDIQFIINNTDFLPYMRKIESVGYDGYGFYAYNFKLLYQKVTNITDRPDPALWKQLDYTSTAITSVSGQTISPTLLETQTPLTNGFVLDLIKDASSTTFVLDNLVSYVPNITPNNLQFGDERFFYGNLNTHIGATIFKTIFDIRVNSSQFNSTTNITRSSDVTTNPSNIKVSEVGIYDSDKNLVCIGKLSTPVALANNNTITLELSIDF
jgi:hypothetical protein